MRKNYDMLQTNTKRFPKMQTFNEGNSNARSLGKTKRKYYVGISSQTMIVCITTMVLTHFIELIKHNRA